MKERILEYVFLTAKKNENNYIVCIKGQPNIVQDMKDLVLNFRYV